MGTLKTLEKFSEGNHNRFKVLASKVRPFIVMHSFVDGPLFDVDNGV
jgi:hypothetical protein